MSLRARVTLAFTAVLALVLTGAGAFLYVQVSSDLQDQQDRGLRSRAAQLASAAQEGTFNRRLAAAPGIEADEDVAQVLAEDGSVVAGTEGADTPLTRRTGGFANGRAPGSDEELRLFALPAAGGTVVVGASREEVTEARASLLGLEALGLGLALLAGAAGAWLLAGVVVRPVQAALERERRFVADASHELRTPLATLKAELEVSRMEGGDAGALRTSLASAEEEVDRLSRLADDLLVLTRDGEGGVPLRTEEIELDTVLERAARGFADVEREPTGLRLEADPARLEQAVRNLVDNAIRHGAPPVELSAHRRDGLVAVEVTDRGAGLSEEFAERALERFSRADPGRGGGGAGLGLAIVDAIARAHGGRVELLDAAPGTRARLELPSSAPGPAAGAR